MYLFNFFKYSDEVQSGKLLEVLRGPHSAGEETGKQLGVLGHVL